MYIIKTRGNSFQRNLKNLCKKYPKEDLYLIWSGKKNENSSKEQNGIIDFLIEKGIPINSTIIINNKEREIYAHKVTQPGSLTDAFKKSYITYINNPPPELWTVHFGPQNTDFVAFFLIDDIKKIVYLLRCGVHKDFYTKFK